LETFIQTIIKVPRLIKLGLDEEEKPLKLIKLSHILTHFCSDVHCAIVFLEILFLKVKKAKMSRFSIESFSSFNFLHLQAESLIFVGDQSFEPQDYKNGFWV